MKITTEQITSGEDELLLRYRELTPQLQCLLDLAQAQNPLLTGRDERGLHRLSPRVIYYFESVDEKLFAYTSDHSYQLSMTLGEAAEHWKDFGFFRCNKSFAVNVNRVTSVRSELGNRIDATLDNGEHIVISRHYASAFRALLTRGGEYHE